MESRMAASEAGLRSRDGRSTHRAGDRLREAQADLEGQLRQLLLGFTQTHGVVITDVGLRYLDGADDLSGPPRDLVVRVTIAV